MVEHQPSKLDTWVRFPSPAFFMPNFKRRAERLEERIRDWLIREQIQKILLKVLEQVGLFFICGTIEKRKIQLSENRGIIL